MRDIIRYNENVSYGNLADQKVPSFSIGSYVTVGEMVTGGWTSNHNDMMQREGEAGVVVAIYDHGNNPYLRVNNMGIPQRYEYVLLFPDERGEYGHSLWTYLRSYQRGDSTTVITGKGSDLEHNDMRYCTFFDADLEKSASSMYGRRRRERVNETVWQMCNQLSWHLHKPKFSVGDVVTFHGVPWIELGEPGRTKGWRSSPGGRESREGQQGTIVGVIDNQYTMAPCRYEYLVEFDTESDWWVSRLDTKVIKELIGRFPAGREGYYMFLVEDTLTGTKPDYPSRRLKRR